MPFHVSLPFGHEVSKSAQFVRRQTQLFKCGAVWPPLRNWLEEIDDGLCLRPEEIAWAAGSNVCDGKLVIAVICELPHFEGGGFVQTPHFLHIKSSRYPLASNFRLLSDQVGVATMPSAVALDCRYHVYEYLGVDRHGLSNVPNYDWLACLFVRDWDAWRSDFGVLVYIFVQPRVRHGVRVRQPLRN